MVQEGVSVKVGDPLVEVDYELIKRKGYDVDTLMVVTTPKETYSIEYAKYNQKVKSSSEAFKITKL